MKVITSLVALSLLGLSQLALADSMLIYNYRFAEGAHGWSADFADYPAGEEEFYELYAGIEKLPSYFDKQRLAFLLSGNNHSADLCMFLRKKVTKLKPNTKYKAFFQTTIASNATSDSFGIGGSPATSVFLKAGASVVRPAAALNGNRRLNIDKGNQSSEGNDAIVLGHIGVDNAFNPKKYMIKTLSNSDPFYIQSDNDGNAWLFIGIDSGYEATTSVFIKRVKASFVEANE